MVVVWDSENPASDAYLLAALSVAKAISVQSAGVNRGPDVGAEGLENAIREVERQAGGLDEITKSTQAIDGHVTKILDRARIVRNDLLSMAARSWTTVVLTSIKKVLANWPA